MRRLPAVGVLFTALCCPWLAEAGQGKSETALKMTLRGPWEPRAASFIVGEPIPVEFRWENSSREPLAIAHRIGPPWTAAMRLQVEGHVNQGCDVFSQLTTLGYLDGVQVLKPNERITRTIDVTQMGIVDPGAYEIWLAYDTGGVSEGFAGGSVARILTESNRLRFEIVAPVGVDAQALKELASPCNEMLGSQAAKQRIISEFPTSTYAGWAMLHREWPSQASPPEPGRGGGEGPWYQQEYSARLERMVRYLAARPDFDGADQMTFWIAWCRAYLGDKGQARGEVKALLAKTDLPPWLRAECERLRDHLEQRAAAPKPADAQPGGVR